jgi:hypothetical protein
MQHDSPPEFPALAVPFIAHVPPAQQSPAFASFASFASVLAQHEAPSLQHSAPPLQQLAPPLQQLAPAAQQLPPSFVQQL